MSDDDATNWAIAETVTLLPFLALHAGMVVFLLRRGRKEKSFRQAFYVFFVVVAGADCVVIIVVRECPEIPSTRRAGEGLESCSPCLTLF